MALGACTLCYSLVLDWSHEGKYGIDIVRTIFLPPPTLHARHCYYLRSLLCMHLSKTPPTPTPQAVFITALWESLNFFPIYLNIFYSFG